MASIIAMRPLPAWTLFALGISLPVAMLELAAEETARAWTDHAREQVVVERAAIASEIRAAYAQADAAGKEVLRGIPAKTREDEALKQLEAASQPFATGFAFDTKTGRVTLAPGSIRPTEPELRELAERSLLPKIAQGEPPGDNGEDISFNLESGPYITARRLGAELTVGWIVDDATIRRGAAPQLPSNLELERAPIEAEARTDRGVNVGIQIGLARDDDPQAGDGGVTDAERERVEKARKAARAVSTEELTHVTLSPFTTTYRVSLKPSEGEAINHVLLLAQRGTFGTVSAGLLALIVFAASLFYRARGAQQLADLRTDFVAAVSHELRTPLASVRMFAELLEAGEVAEDERPEVEHALAGETRRLNATLDRMLRFGALARGKLAPQKEKQRIAPLLEEAAARATNVTLDVDPALEANVDGGLVGLALDNLLSNAKKYAPAGGPYLVRARADRRWLYLDVADKGPGLGWRARRLVWKPFERADARLSKATEGSGVGLALIRGIAEAHGGTATVVSKPGHGATFTLRLPRA